MFITDTNVKYLEVVTYLEDDVQNLDEFMAGELCIFGQVQRYCVLDYLPRDYDNVVHSYLQVITPAICELSRRLYKYHLLGGQAVRVDNRYIKSVPKTSSVFGQLDQLMRTKHSTCISTLEAESCIMFLNNKTSEWLNSKETIKSVNL